MRKRIRQTPKEQQELLDPKLVAFARRMIKSDVTHANWDEWHCAAKKERLRASRADVQKAVFFALQRMTKPGLSRAAAKRKAAQEATDRDELVQRQWRERGF